MILHDVRVYAGKHYGQIHEVMSTNGRWLICLHRPSGDRVKVHVCDVEDVPSPVLSVLECN